MKILKERFAIIDENGVGVPGKEAWFYPIGTTAHGTKATEVTGKPGQYNIAIDPSGDNLVISHYYDVWYDGVLQIPKLTLSDKWQWFCTVIADAAQKDFPFSGMTDENGASLPTTIPNVALGLLSFSKGRLFYISVQDTTKITVKAQDFADDDCVNLAVNPVTIKILVTVTAKT